MKEWSSKGLFSSNIRAMGCIQSSQPPPPFKPNNEFLGQSQESYDYLLSLGFERTDIDYLFRAFDDMDGDSRGFVRVDEIKEYLKLDSESIPVLTSYLLTCSDVKMQQIDFLQFSVALWNFLSSYDMTALIYPYVDKDYKKIISVPSAQILVEALLNIPIEKSTSIVRSNFNVFVDDKIQSGVVCFGLI